MTEKTCRHCKFWSQWAEQPNPQIVIGDCRRHAPQIFPSKEKFITKFPSTKIADFCGSFKPRLAME